MLDGLRQLIPLRRLDKRRIAAGIPAGERVYAIGDIHGRADLLRDLLGQIVADAAGFAGKVTLVGIGDYIDRGPDSKGVVTCLLEEVPAGWHTVFLRGNHEQGMMDFMTDPAEHAEWLGWGGVQALESYGIALYGAMGVRDLTVLRDELVAALTESGHGAFFEATQLSYVCGSYLFVHAGVRPLIPLGDQMAEDLMFIREDFIRRPHKLPYRIVFGHTILPEPLIENDRIGIDTGAFQSHKLSAVKLETDTVTILQTAA